MSKNGELIACAGDGAVLRCVEQRLTEVPCRGPQGCSGGAAPVCDMSVGQDGDLCVVPEYRPSQEDACSVDKTHTLICTGKALESRFEPGRSCRGPKACVIEGTMPKCDQIAAEAGDRCITGQSAFGACSTDKKQLLACEGEDRSPLGTYGGKFVSKRECPTSKGCEMLPVDGSPDSLAAYCDYGAPAPGAPCGKGYENLEWCAEGKTSIVKCDPESHTFLFLRDCPKGEICQPYNGHRDIPSCARPK